MAVIQFYSCLVSSKVPSKLWNSHSEVLLWELLTEEQNIFFLVSLHVPHMYKYTLFERIFRINRIVFDHNILHFRTPVSSVCRRSSSAAAHSMTLRLFLLLVLVVMAVQAEKGESMDSYGHSLWSSIIYMYVHMYKNSIYTGTAKCTVTVRSNWKHIDIEKIRYTCTYAVTDCWAPVFTNATRVKLF